MVFYLQSLESPPKQIKHIANVEHNVDGIVLWKMLRLHIESAEKLAFVKLMLG